MVHCLYTFVTQNRLNPFVSEDLSTCIANPIRFRATHSRLAYGYEANGNQRLALRCAKYNGTFARMFTRYRQR